MRTRMLLVGLLAGLALGFAACASRPPQASKPLNASTGPFEELWVYTYMDWDSDVATDALIDMMRKAKASGVTHVNIKDPKLYYLEAAGP